MTSSGGLRCRSRAPANDYPQARLIISAAAGLGEVVVQTRKTYVSLVTPRRLLAPQVLCYGLAGSGY